MADPGFPRGGGANPRGGAPTYYLANFSRKLHENEEILGRGGGRVPGARLDPPLVSNRGSRVCRISAHSHTRTRIWVRITIRIDSVRIGLWLQLYFKRNIHTTHKSPPPPSEWLLYQFLGQGHVAGQRTESVSVHVNES